MKHRDRQERKAYGMRRMGLAIGRAMAATTADEQKRAVRWVAAWGMICGIRSEGVRLRQPELLEPA